MRARLRLSWVVLQRLFPGSQSHSLATTDFSLSYTRNTGTLRGYSGLYAPTGGFFPFAPKGASPVRFEYPSNLCSFLAC